MEGWFLLSPRMVKARAQTDGVVGGYDAPVLDHLRSVVSTRVKTDEDKCARRVVVSS